MRCKERDAALTAQTRSRVVSVLSRLLLIFALFGVSACLISRTWAGVMVYLVFAAIAAVVFLRQKHRSGDSIDSATGR